MLPRSPEAGCLSERSQPPSDAFFDVGDVVAVVDLHTVVAQVRGQLAGQRAEVDVGTLRRTRRGNALVAVTALDDERGPLADLGVVLGVLHAAEQRVLLERLVPGLEEAGIVVADHEAHVRDGVDEVLGGPDQGVGHEV
jgi:hypothetical protein